VGQVYTTATELALELALELTLATEELDTLTLLALLEVVGVLSLPPPPPHAERTSISPLNRKPVFFILLVSKLSPDFVEPCGARQPAFFASYQTISCILTDTMLSVTRAV